MSIEPIGSRVLVRVVGESNRTRGGLVIPEMALDNTPWLRGEVVAAGPGSYSAEGRFIPITVGVGDVVVFFRSQDGRQIVVPGEDGEDLLLIQEGYICGKVVGKPESPIVTLGVSP
jgi:chaperonin GroES